MKILEDEQLMLQVAQSDMDAFKELVSRHQDSAWRIAYRFLGNSAEAEDVAQEAFLRILAAAPRYKPRAAFTTYLYLIVSRLCIDSARKKRPLRTNTFPEMMISSSDEETAIDPVTILVEKDRDALIRKSIDELPPRQRMVIILKYYEGLSYGEIAHVMGTTAKAVERLLSRGRKMLQGSLLPIKK